ncbi:choline/carnitine O-acyltransferase [Serinibacter salmoneus]|nr:choline/carnitine O-acyltransferase [Serinibacter salmoneus]
MTPLPVPPLRQSLDRYLAAVRPLVTEAQVRHTEAVVAEFAATDGPACQAALERRAASETSRGESWLSVGWLEGYLATRESLPLSSNVAFHLALSAPGAGVARAAAIIRRIAAVHLAHLRGELAGEVTGRGDAVDPRQRAVLAGGLRHPRPGRDETQAGRPGVADREVGVLWRGHLVMIPIADGAGHPFPAAAVERSLVRAMQEAPVQSGTFTHLSYLGSEAASQHLSALLQDARNAATYRRLRDALFLVNLRPEAAEPAQALRSVAFELDQAWAYKPLTYQVGLADDHVSVHVEHSLVDGGTLHALVAQMQTVGGDDERGVRTAGAVGADLLEWVTPPEQRERLAAQVQAYRAEAATMRVQVLRAPNPIPADARISGDAVAQATLTYAQLATYGRVRSAYEAVDMREYLAGRTECLRPVTTEAVALARGLLEQEAPEHLLTATLEAHKQRVIACKRGQSFERHLLGLRWAADELGLTPALFSDPSYAALTTDFLSTTSLGREDPIVRFVFAPTSPGGIGVNYTPHADGGRQVEFCLIHRDGEAQQVARFAEAIQEGTAAIAAALRA